MMIASDFPQTDVTTSWLKLLDEAALLRYPDAHHRKLLDGAPVLYRPAM